MEKKPDMSALTRSRPLERGGNSEAPACLGQCTRVFLPVRSVQVHSQEEARFIEKHWINTHHEIAAGCISPRQMPANRFIAYTVKAAVGTLDATKSG